MLLVLYFVFEIYAVDLQLTFCCVQSRTETEIMKLKDKITKTKDQLAQLYPKYDTERRNEEHAASQCVLPLLHFDV